MAALYWGSWGFRAVADVAQGYNKRGSAREKAVTKRFGIREASAIDAEYHQSLAAVDETLERSLESEQAPLRAITVHYRMLGGNYRTTGAGTTAIPIIAPTSRWGVQVGDYIYELRQERDQDEGDNVDLAMTGDRIIVNGTKSIHVAETRLSDNQIMGRASYIFKQLFTSNYNVLIGNHRSFAIFLRESTLEETERHTVREKLQSKSSLYSNVAGSVAVSLRYYLAAGMSKDANDMLTLVGSLSTEGERNRIEAWKEGMHEAMDKEVGCFGQNISAPEGLPYPANALQ